MSNRPLIMGILNVTPDSFTDGGRYLDPTRAIEWAQEMIAEGAEWIDVGGESTRPGADPVSLETELTRTIPVVQALAERGIKVSIDTSKPQVARRAIEAGAQMINDVTGLRDPEMFLLAAETTAMVCIMHMQGEPRTMQSDPTYVDVVKEVRDYLVAQAEALVAAGHPREGILVDPGFGFGKTLDHNLRLLKHLQVCVDTGFPVLVGLSRKSFLGRIVSGTSTPASVDDRLGPTIAAQTAAQVAGVAIIRTHWVRETVTAARLTDSLLKTP